MNRRGFTLIEVIVAMVLLSATSAMLTRTVIASQRAAHGLAALREAQRLAEAALETTRAGHAVPELPAGSFWRRSVSVTPAASGLRRMTVAVEHREDAALSVHLEGLRWIP